MEKIERTNCLKENNNWEESERIFRNRLKYKRSRFRGRAYGMDNTMKGSQFTHITKIKYV